MHELKFRFPPPFFVRAALFDLDGTLIDTAGDLSTAVNLTLGDLGFPNIDFSVARGFIGSGIKELVRRSLGYFHEPSQAELDAAMGVFMRHYAAHLTGSSRVYPGVIGTLERLRERGIALGCVTNKLERFATPLIAALGLNAYLSVVVAGDSLPGRKPDPLPLLHASRALGDIAAAQVIVVGDSRNDIQAARAAGMPSVCVSYGYHAEENVSDLEADAIVDSFSELLGLVVWAGPR
jgi:phosphoglycolate phosphatase